MALAPQHFDGDIRFLGDDDARAYFDAQSSRLLGISGEEFLRRYAAGEYAATTDAAEQRAVMKLAMLAAIGR